MRQALTCGCQYDGPMQAVSCADHNAAAKNLNRAQAMLVKLELERDRYRTVLETIAKTEDCCSLETPHLTVQRLVALARATLRESNEQGVTK